MIHCPVVRESAVSTKIRPVLDTSAKRFNGIFLNDSMEVGPTSWLSLLIFVLISTIESFNFIIVHTCHSINLQAALEPV